jgi:hypothetical protein
MLMADTAQGTKGRYVVSTTAVVDVPAFQKALAGFEDKVVAGAYPTTDLARQAFYDLSDKYTVRAIIWEDTPNLGDIVAYGKIKGLLRKTEYQNRAGEEKQSWELYQVTSALVTKERKAVKLGSYRDSANIIDNAAKTETPQGATPSGAPKPPPTSGAPTPKPKTPVMKMIDGEAYSVEALLAGKWLQADIDALPNA